MEESILGDGRMDYHMVKEQKLIVMETSMKGNGGMENIMVKEQKLTLMEKSMKGNSSIIKCGTEYFTTVTGTLLESTWMGYRIKQ